MLNRMASLAMSTSVLEALPGKLDIKRHSPSILYFLTATEKNADFLLYAAFLNVYFYSVEVSLGICLSITL